MALSIRGGLFGRSAAGRLAAARWVSRNSRPAARPRSFVGSFLAGVRDLARARKGLASLEFVLVAMPLLMVVFGFVSLCAVFFTMSAMQISAQFTGRLISTGQIKNLANGPISYTNTTSTTSCGTTLSSSQAEYYACAGLPTWASFSVTTTEDCAVPSVTVTISTNGSAAAIADVMHVFTGKTISATAVVMKEGLCP